MSIALETQLKIERMFVKNREYLLIEAHNQFPDETLDHAMHLLQRKYIDDELKETIAKSFHNIVDMTNGLSSQELAKYFLGGLLTQHHYLQDEFWNTILHLMKQYANADDRHFDGQNEHARKMCQEIYVNWLSK